jgi:hypothetical protein
MITCPPAQDLWLSPHDDHRSSGPRPLIQSSRWSPVLRPKTSDSVLTMITCLPAQDLWFSPHDDHRSSGPRPLIQSSRWSPVLRPKTSNTLFWPVNFSDFIYKYIKINSRIWFGPVNSNFHFEDCWLKTPSNIWQNPISSDIQMNFRIWILLFK